MMTPLYVRLLKIIVTNKNRDCTHQMRQETQETTGLPKISMLLAWGLAATSTNIIVRMHNKLKIIGGGGWGLGLIQL